uniref:Uncharacterized protein n=1 Tax=Hanusia phi TaxID=3032 RepID=A0A7S0ECM1_9CRYP
MIYSDYLESTLEIILLKSVVGKLAFLTVQCLYIQTGYFVLRFISEITPSPANKASALKRWTYWFSAVAGGLGYFVTIMFYKFCWFNEKFQKNVVAVHEAKGVPFGLYQHILHVPCSILPIIDLLIMDSKILKENIGSVRGYLVFYVCFGFWYSSLITTNFFITGAWPYPFMEAMNFFQHVFFHLFAIGFSIFLGMFHRYFLQSYHSPHSSSKKTQ